MIAAASTRAAADETYADVCNLIYSLAHRFQHRYGGDIDDLIGIGNVQHARLYRDFNARPAAYAGVTFTQALTRWVWFGLLDVRRREAKRHAAHPACPLPDQLAAPAAPEFSVGDFLDGLAEDARTVARLALGLDTPVELQRTIEAKGSQPRNVRSSIRDYLLARGWTAARVSGAFAEIKVSLV